MDELTVLFARPHRAPSGQDRLELEEFALEELGVESYAIPLDAIVNGDAARALRGLPRPRGRTWLYRGWLIDEAEYTDLYEAMAERDEQLVVDPEAFATATYAPAWIPILGTRTAPSRWTENEDIDEAWELANELGPPPWIVKDHVKSAKEDWRGACYVPAEATRSDFAAICERLVELRGDRFERGFVIRRYLDLASAGGHLEDGRPVPDEHRLFFWEGELVAHAPYHDVDRTLEDTARFADLGEIIDSPFFSVDVARLSGGGYTIIEVNDGGCSTLPEQLDPRELYGAIVR